MKKLLVLFLIFTGMAISQVVYDKNNSTTTNLGSSSTFTGTKMRCDGYRSIIIMLFANKASATSGLKVQFSYNGTSSWKTKAYWTYSINDSLRTFITPVQGVYYRVVYTNTADSSTSFYLRSYLNQGEALNYDKTGNLLTDITGGITLGDITVNNDSLEATMDRSNYLLQKIRELETALKDTNKSQTSRLLDYVNQLEGYLSAFKDTSKAQKDRGLAYSSTTNSNLSAFKDTAKSQNSRLLDYVNQLEGYLLAFKDTNKSQISRLLDYVNQLEGYSSALKDTNKAQMDRNLYLLQTLRTIWSSSLTMILSQAVIDSLQNSPFWITNVRTPSDSILENNKENNTLTQANRVLLTTTITRLDSILANITEGNTLDQTIRTAVQNHLLLAKTDSIITSFTTLTTETDSITLPAGKFVDIYVKSIDDTIQVSLNRSFTNPWRLYPTEGDYIAYALDVSVNQGKVWIKQYSAGTVSGTANYGVKIEKRKL
jgi:hypothetical protein